jgi:hypothetical protein
MAYLMINGIDFSKYVNELEVKNDAVFTSQKNAAGDTVVDYINRKRAIKVGIIPLDAAAMLKLQNVINELVVSLTFLNPVTNALEENIQCILPSNNVSYYTIQAGKTLFNRFSLEFTEL